MIDNSLMAGIRSPAFFGKSVADIAEELGIEVGSTPPEPEDFIPDMCPFTINKREFNILQAVGLGLAKIFNADREMLNSPRRFDVDESAK